MKEKLVFLITIVSFLFSLPSNADTYWVDSQNIQYKISFNGEIYLGYKCDGLNLIPISSNKTDSIRKEIKKEEEAIEKIKEEKEKERIKKVTSDFSINVLKFSMTLLLILLILICVRVLNFLILLGMIIWIIFKKDLYD